MSTKNFIDNMNQLDLSFNVQTKIETKNESNASLVFYGNTGTAIITIKIVEGEKTSSFDLAGKDLLSIVERLYVAGCIPKS